MASKLYPPQVDGILPAFYKSYDDNDKVTGAELAIPFGLNRAVALKEIYKLRIRLKTVSTNTEKYNGTSVTWDKTNLIAYFNIDATTAEELNEGQFYKAQLAFIDKDINTADETIGYWSTVGTIKCVARPKVTIAGFNEKEVNGFIQEFVGEYQQDTTFGDSTEKVEEYEFNIWDLNNDLILSSGLCLHNSADDVSSSSSTDIFKTNHLIKEGSMYYIQYKVKTLNNLQIASPIYKIMQTESVNIEYPLELHGHNNYDEGYIELYLRGQLVEYTDSATGKTSLKEQMYTGTFLITRGSDKDDYFEWNEIIRFNMDSGYPSQYTFRDFTVEQGITYKYRIQQYNIHKLYSNPIYLTDENPTADDNGNNVYKEIAIVADFEDMFLYDGKRQLKVRFNPKVASFKNSIPEQKIETIGSKYPFIFRNGHVNYKEFPIAGLISYSMDDAMLFLNSTELEEAKILEPTYVRSKSGYLELTKNPVTDYKKSIHQDMHKVVEDGAQPMIFNIRPLWHSGAEKVYDDKNIKGEITGINRRIVRQDKNLTTENMMGERYFKLKVLDWLTNGEVKLFRSPGEGNYLVRVLNVSMTPNDTVGRMLHSFTGTCYEIDDLTYNNLIYYGIVTENVVSLTEMHWGSGSGKNILEDTSPSSDGYYTIPLNSDTVLGFECVDFAPGDIIKIIFAGLDGEQEIVIGNTGAYYYHDDDRIIIGLQIKPHENYDPYIDFSRTINYNYEGIQNRKFDTVSSINTQTQIAHQYIGPQNNVLEHYSLRNGDTPKPFSDELVEEIQLHPNIRLNEDTIKFDVLQVEILHAQVRPLIPVFALGDIGIEDGRVAEPNGYSLTPFGTGYVNYHTIYVEDGEHLDTLDGEVLQRMIEESHIYVNKYDIQDINFTLSDFTPTPIDAYSILQVFIPKADTNGELTLWQPTDFYYDTYKHDWMRSYEPYISINADSGILYNAPKDIMEIDAQTGKVLNLKIDDTQYNPRINFIELSNENNSNKIYLDDIQEVTFTKLGKINKLEIGNGAMVEVTFQLQIVDYQIEDENIIVNAARKAYEEQKAYYFNNMDDFYKKRLGEEYQELDKKIDDILNNIRNIYKNTSVSIEADGPVPTSHNDEVKEWYKNNSDANGTPQLYDSYSYIEDDEEVIVYSEYRKIIDSIESILNDAVNAVPLKRQLLILQSDMYNELLYGWNDEDNPSIHYLGLLDLQPMAFGTNEPMFTDINDTSDTWYYHSLSDSQDHFLMPLENNNGIIRWWPYNYTSKNSGQAYYVYNWAPTITETTQENDKRLSTDNSFEIIKEDKGYGNTISSILWKINPDYNCIDEDGKVYPGIQFLNQTNTPELVFIQPETISRDAAPISIDNHSYTEEDYNNGVYSWKWDNETAIIDNSKEEYREENKDNYNSLNKYIQDSKYGISAITSLGEEGVQIEPQQTLNELQSKHIISLYMLAHTPVLETENNIIVNDLGLYQKTVENDYGPTIEAVIDLMLQIDNSLDAKKINDILLQKIQILYRRMQTFNPNTVAYIAIDENHYQQVYQYLDRRDKKVEVAINDNITKVYDVIEESNTCFYKNDNNEDVYLYESSIKFVFDEFSTPIEKENNEYYIIDGFNNKKLVSDLLKEALLAEIENGDTKCFISQSFWNKKIGCLIEAKDDVLISLYDLINLITDYVMLQRDFELKEKIANNLWYGYNRSIAEYIQTLDDIIVNAQTGQANWKVARDEAQRSLEQAILNEATPKEIEKLQALYTTAVYKIKDYALTEAETVAEREAFITNNANYTNYVTALQDLNTTEELYIQFLEGYQNLLSSYLQKREIYLAFRDYTYDILLRNSSRQSRNEPFYNSQSEAMQEEFDDFIEKTQLNSNIEQSIDGQSLLNYYFSNNKIDIRLGYFTIKDLCSNNVTQEDWENYKDTIASYESAEERLLERYKYFINEINSLYNIYKNRISFVNNLQAIQQEYRDKTELERAQLIGMFNDLRQYLDNKESLNTELPSDEELEEIKEKLAEYLLTLQKYYIEEVERRYNT